MFRSIVSIVSAALVAPVADTMERVIAAHKRVSYFTFTINTTRHTVSDPSYLPIVARLIAGVIDGITAAVSESCELWQNLVVTADRVTLVVWGVITSSYDRQGDKLCGSV